MHTTPWRKSSRSASSGDGANCVEARAHCNVFDVRDSKIGDDSPVFTVEAADFAGFLRTCVAADG